MNFCRELDFLRVLCSQFNVGAFLSLLRVIEDTDFSLLPSYRLNLSSSNLDHSPGRTESGADFFY